jgi:acyl carrier protein
MSTTEDKLRKIVSDLLGVPPDSIKHESRFIEDLNADSLDVIEMVMIFEEQFGYEIPKEAAEGIETFGSALKYLTEAANDTRGTVRSDTA